MTKDYFYRSFYKFLGGYVGKDIAFIIVLFVKGLFKALAFIVITLCDGISWVMEFVSDLVGSVFKLLLFCGIAFIMVMFVLWLFQTVMQFLS